MPIHYSQQNAGHTKFADGSFDLIVSNLLLHEIPQKLTKQIIAECYRLLTPGGVIGAQRHGGLADRSVPGIHGGMEQPSQQ